MPTEPHDHHFDTDHVGSLLRSPELIEARNDLGAGPSSPAPSRKQQGESIRGVVTLQRKSDSSPLPTVSSSPTCYIRTFAAAARRCRSLRRAPLTPRVPYGEEWI
jgi:hypothetical protein